MIQQSTFQATIPDGETVSNSVNVEGFVWALIEVPSGDESVALTLEMLSGDGSTWVTLVAISDTTNRVKALTADEMAAFGPAKFVRLKVGSGVSGDKLHYLHLST